MLRLAKPRLEYKSTSGQVNGLCVLDNAMNNNRKQTEGT